MENSEALRQGAVLCGSVAIRLLELERRLNDEAELEEDHAFLSGAERDLALLIAQVEGTGGKRA
jgi:hypothetical protein